MLPKITEYHQAISNPESFKTLYPDIKPLKDENGELIFASGNFAVVYKVLHKNQFYAVKCFLKEQEERIERLKAISNFINDNPSPYWLNFEVLEKELWVETSFESRDYSIVLMPWIQSPTLGNSIQNKIEQNLLNDLKTINDNLKQMFRWILNSGFAHGDLKPDNILIYENSLQPILLDYDGMFIPEFDGLNAIELGSPCFQHPKRHEVDFHENIDDFSMFIILFSISILQLRPDLWKDFHHDQNIIFDEKDFNELQDSRLIQIIENDASLDSYFQTFQEIDFVENDNINFIEIFLNDGLDFRNIFYDKINGIAERKEWFLSLDNRWLELLKLKRGKYYKNRLFKGFFESYSSNINEIFNTIIKLKKIHLSVFENKDLIPLVKLTNLQAISLTVFTSENYINEYNFESLRNLKRLDILKINDSNFHLKSIRGIEKVKKLISLKLTGVTKVEDLSLISQLTNLKSLHISLSFDYRFSYQIATPWWFSTNERREAHFENSKKLKNLEFLGSNKKIEDLFLADFQGVEKLEFLRNIKNLQFLEIINCEKIQNLDLSSNTSLKSIKLGLLNLKKLDLTKNNQLIELEFRNLTNLKSVELDHENNIENLEINSFKESNLDYSFLESLFNLKKVKFASIDNLTSIPLDPRINKNLEVIVLWNLKIENYNNLKFFPNLKVIHADKAIIEKLPRLVDVIIKEFDEYSLSGSSIQNF
jgi:hypothetical protein